MTHGRDGELTDGARRWGPAIAVAAVVATFLAGLPLLELALAANPAPPVIQVPARSSAGPLTMTVEPAVGWSDAGGKADASLLLRAGAATFSVEVHDGASCAELEEAAVAEVRTDDPEVPRAGYAYVTPSLDGIVRSWTGAITEGLVFTSCAAGAVVAVVARGPVGSLTADGFGAVQSMLESVEPR